MSAQPTGYNLPTNSKAPDASIRFSYSGVSEDFIAGSHRFWTILTDGDTNRSRIATSYEHQTSLINQLMHHRAHQSEY